MGGLSLKEEKALLPSKLTLLIESKFDINVEFKASK
jgi:hypothetical protein